MDDEILRPKAAAAFLGISTSTMSKWRLTGRGPEFIRIGEHLVGYRRSALDRFASARVCRSTSERT